jgi:hypothetical protein
MSQSAQSDQSTDAPKILYLTTLYPAASHTFILREILALRELGLDVQTASVRKPGAQHMIGQVERDEAAKTYYVLGRGALWRTFKAHGYLKTTRPLRYLRTFGMALRLRRPGVKGFLKQFAYFAEAGIIAQHMQKNGITHLHNHFGDQSATVAMLAAQLSGVPYSFTIHGPTDLLDPVGWAMAKKIELSNSPFASVNSRATSHPKPPAHSMTISCSSFTAGFFPKFTRRRRSSQPKAFGLSSSAASIRSKACLCYSTLLRRFMKRART